MSSSNEKSPITDIQQQAIDWLVRLRSDNMNDQELAQFAEWLAADIEHSDALSQAEELFEEMCMATDLQTDEDSITQNHSELAVQQVDSQVIQMPVSKPKKGFPWLTTSLAMTAVWLLVIGLIVPQQASLLDNFFSDYHTKTGEIKSFQLSDGSSVLLNTNSAISINFNDSVRKIVLHHGQVRFTVANESQRPFEVVSGNLVVRALGTVFDVYKSDDNETKVVVQEHAVSTRLQSTELTQVQTILVQQGQQLSYQSGKPLLPAKDINLKQAVGWQNHRLYINDQPLAELIAELERHQIGRIFLADEKLKQLRVTGIFSLENPNEVLNSVCKALNLKQTQLGPWWVLLYS